MKITTTIRYDVHEEDHGEARIENSGDDVAISLSSAPLVGTPLLFDRAEFLALLASLDHAADHCD